MQSYQLFKEYRKNIKIDYFAYFAKCYFAFNAYLKAKFDGNDREKIDRLKNDIAPKNRFLELLDNDLFNRTLIEFSDKLSETSVKNDEKIVSFEMVKIQAFQNKSLPEIMKNTIKYELSIIAGKDEKVKFKCINANNEDLCEIIECKYTELEQRLNKTRLSETQRKTIKSSFDEEIKKYNRNLISIINKGIDRSDIEKELIYKGFIEIIYLLRNALFHSQIDPGNEQMYNIYKLSYQLFKDFLYKLPEEQ